MTAYDSSTPIRDVRFAVVDTETTGLSTDDDRVLQIGVVVARGDGSVEHQFVTYLKRLTWGLGHVGAFHVHGITRRQLRKGMKPVEALEMMNVLIDGCVFTAHNAKFDISFLEAESERVGMKREVRNYLDTLALAREADSDRQRKHSLQALCDHYGVTVERAHEAMSDAKATATILLKLIDELGVRSTDQLPGLSSE